VVLEYAVPGACWSPSYVLTLAGAKAKLGMRAMVAQRTGEDWTGVALRLSTAEADAWVELPELAKARIGRAQPPRPKLGYREPPEGAQALYADYDRVAGPPEAATKSGSLATLDDERTPPRLEATASFGAPAPTGGAPLPPMMMQAAPARSSTLAGAILAASGAAAAPLVALGGAMRAPQSKARAAKADLDMLYEAAADEGETQTRLPEPANWELAAESLSYARLRMRPPSDASRGELVAIAQSAVYLEAFGARIRIDVGAAIRVAFSRAEIDDAALPPGYEIAHTTDAYDYAYAAELPCDVAADGAFRAVPVADWDATTRLRHVAVPREAQQVYRMLDIESPIDAALLTGPLDVYEGSGDDVTYRTTTRMPETPPLPS